MLNELTIKIWLKVNEQLLVEAAVKKDAVRILELMLHKDLLKSELINLYQNERKVKDENNDYNITNVK